MSMMTFFFFLIMFFFVMVMNLISLMISVNFKINKYKLSPFECGFEPKFMFRSPLSVRFFIIIILFLIFDIEISLIMPLPFLMLCNNYYQYFLIILIILIILISGILHEWSENTLDWVN